MKKFVPVVSAFALLTGFVAYAVENSDVSAFRSFKEIGEVKDIRVPTVVEVPLEHETLGRESFAVLEKETEAYQPYYLHVQTTGTPTSVIAETAASSGAPGHLLDRNFESAVTYDLPVEGLGRAEIILKTPKPVSSNSISVILAPHVAPPVSVELRATTETGDKVIVARKNFPGQTILFPETNASVWRLTFEYAQPLRIAEITLEQKNVSYSVTKSLHNRSFG